MILLSSVLITIRFPRYIYYYDHQDVIIEYSDFMFESLVVHDEQWENYPAFRFEAIMGLYYHGISHLSVRHLYLWY